jgi:uncharacterized membrane protein
VAERRLQSIDLIRGAVMVLMAIDHVRVFAGVPSSSPVPSVFFTRWITHFCAPAFVFLAGTSAWFYGRRHEDLSRFLITRGLWLVFLELTVLRLAWTFNLDFRHYEMAGVLWVIGWSMIVLAGLAKLPLRWVTAIGIVVVAGHNLLDPFLPDLTPKLAESSLSGLWKILYLSFYAGPIRLGEDGPSLIVLYSIVPWVGVIALGYAFARVLTFEPQRRDRLCLALGLCAIALFLVLRGTNLYGDPRPWTSEGMPAALSFLNTTKYPASLSFLLMTLGPTVAAIPLAERARGPIASGLAVFGRVPFFFYLLHVPLIHLLAIVVSWVRLGGVSPWLFANHPMGNPPPPEGYPWSLPLLYGVWLVAIGMLYVPCRWWAGLKARRSDAWLRYL